MPQTNLNPQHVSLLGLLHGRLFRIPDYQRAYSWGKAQREDLFHDIGQAAERQEEHYLATMVGHALGDVVTIGAGEYHRVDVVDGQQRLTSLVILLKALEKRYAETGEIAPPELTGLLVKADNTHLLLQTNHDVGMIYRHYIENGDVPAARPALASDAALYDAINECEAFVEQWREENGLQSLAVTLFNRLTFIFHQVEDEAVVYRVFETLNSRGLSVRWIDKLKSQLMGRLYEVCDDESLTERLGVLKQTWASMYRLFGLNLALGDEVLRFVGTWHAAATPRKLVGEEEALKNIVSDITDAASIQNIADELLQATQVLKELLDTPQLNAPMRIINSRYLAVSLLRSGLADNRQAPLFRFWEKVSFRLFGLARADARSGVGSFVSLAFRVYHGNTTAQSVQDELTALAHSVDLAAIMENESYWNDCYTNWRENLRYLLCWYEAYLIQEHGGAWADAQWQLIWGVRAADSIEHIMPQNVETDYMHHLGNLTLLPLQTNQHLQDALPADKFQIYSESGIRHTMAVPGYLADGEEWGADAVMRRAKDIKDFICMEWGS